MSEERIEIDGLVTTQSQLDAFKRMRDNIDRAFIFGDLEIRKERAKRNEDNRKWAYIRVGNTRKLAMVDNKTMEAYKLDGYNPTWIKHPKHEFVRWCTSFDL